MIIPVADRLKNVADYYFARKLEEIRQLELQGHKIISFGIGSPDLAPSEATIDRLIESATNPSHHGYQPYKGIPLLREKISEWYSHEYGVTLNPATEILPLMGS
ncbi:MAG: aminotransferase class I/II-fold pyridoxal phosphate-dependent enzyme, partial [Cytophagales bacterium]|nr:aminotransferase class I/II-fold pyridoxal phosphate-dependent enzyme [Cytophagales bacterium]